MNRFERVVQILDDAIGGPGVGIASHGTFWRGLTRDEFVAAKVLDSFALVVVGDGAGSNLVKALKGEAPFGDDLDPRPPGASMPRMPFGFPVVSDEHIQFIQQWIDDGCAEDPLPTDHVLTWRPTVARTARRYDDIWFVTTEVGWAVNSDGHILKTTDGGASWEQQFHVTAENGANVWLRCIGFATENRGWVGTTAGANRLYDTRDGGATWSPVTNLPAEAPSAICGLSVVSESVVYAAGTNFPFPRFPRPPRMMKTVDGGANWTAWDMRPHAALLVDTYFTSPDRGWVVGGKVHPVMAGANQCLARPDRDNVKPVVLLTEDGGKTWSNRVADLEDEFPLGEWGWKIFFLNEEVGYVSLENFCSGAVLKTTDGGQTWQRLAINDAQNNANLEGLGFVDEDHGWVGGWGSADMQRGSSSETTDGGRTWRDADWGEAVTGEFLNRFRFVGDPVTVGYASGNTIYKYSIDPVPVVPQVAAAAAEPHLFDNAEPVEAFRPAHVPIIVPSGASRLEINIFDRFGDHVRHLSQQAHPTAGPRVLEWDVTNDAGERLDAGYYFVRATVDDQSDSTFVWIRD